MSAMLQKLLGFTRSDITLLKDANATKANIITNLKNMVAAAKAGKFSYVVFSMSSHGTRVPDLDGDEKADHQDEAFCPHDLAEANGQWDRKHIIIDDELRDIFIQLPENVLLEVYLDTCHSGTGLKEIDLLLDRKPRFISQPTPKAFHRITGTRVRGVQMAMMEKGIVHHILWAGCRDDQTSADAHIAGSWHGAFTYFFCKEMYACNNKLSRAQVLAKVRLDLAGAGYSQVPQLECEATKRDLMLPTTEAIGAFA
jgi:hypothetical protein